jgi:hypothetical protein
MAQHDYVIANANGATVRADINNALLAISSTNSGTSEPSTMYAYEMWVDTTTSLLKLRNAANNAWITLGLSVTASNTVDINGGAIDGTAIGASSATTGAFTTLTTTDNLSIGGSNKELRFYEGSNYVGFEAPALTGDQIWILPIEDGDADQVLQTNGSGTLTWATAGGTTINNNADNRVITGSGTANTLNGETGLTWDGTTFGADGGAVFNDSSADVDFRVESNGQTHMLFVDGGGDAIGMGFSDPNNATLAINGRVCINNNDNPNNHHSYGDDLIIGNTSNAGGGMTILGTTTGYSRIQFADGNTGSGTPGLIQYGHTDNLFVWLTSDTERMRLDSSGNVGIGLTSYNERLKVSSAEGNTAVVAFEHTGTAAQQYGLHLRLNGNPNDTTRYFLQGVGGASGSDTVHVNIYSNGNITNTNNSYGSTSDATIKENIVDATDKLSDLKQVKVRNFNLIGESDKQIGMIAQELESIFPSLVFEDEETEKKAIKYSVFVPILIKAIQELEEKVTALENA